jgi:hypothetical protein
MSWALDVTFNNLALGQQSRGMGADIRCRVVLIRKTEDCQLELIAFHANNALFRQIRHISSMNPSHP